MKLSLVQFLAFGIGSKEDKFLRGKEKRIYSKLSAHLLLHFLKVFFFFPFFKLLLKEIAAESLTTIQGFYTSQKGSC